MNKLNSYLQLIRFYNPIGFWLLLWPGFWGLFIHPGFEISHFVIVLLGSFLTRSLGCAINDFIDKDIDGKVFRTKDRPIAAGLITKFEAKIFIILLSLICLFLLSMTNEFTIKLVLFAAVPLIIIYPLAKRFISIPQIILGITFGLSLPISYSIVHGTIHQDAIFLYVACIFWIIAYDGIYALSDYEDDIRIKLNSLPVIFKENTAAVVLMFYFIFMIMIAIYAFTHSLELLAIGLLFLIYQMYLQFQMIKSERYIEAFKSNSHVGLVIAMIFFIENQNELFS